ncbi:SRPBCC family protein [Mycobacterium decipiens]|uniref:ATPase n=1 Tax=Mycobacterium decipiens TaxID=1430326 RepID=A0A1X2LX93_9MYCO|nr:SRPBCC family protein [Mycobacterium decipiens]OSC41178.1 ATPase [Mycobacterium decipiens]
MNSVDVAVSLVIGRGRSVVANYCCDPDNATEWYANIKTVRWETPKPLVLGSRFAFTAAFMGRTLRYTYQVVELEPGRRLVMRTAQDPFPMETTYTWDDEPTGNTRMTLRNRGEPAGFFRLLRPVMAMAISRATRGDLRRLRSILEGNPAL